MINLFAIKISHLSGWRAYGLAWLIGAFSALSQSPFDLGWLCFFTFPLLVWLLDGIIAPTAKKQSANALKKAALIGWCFGFGYFVAGLWWLGSALLVEADQFAWAIPLAVLGLPAFLAFFYAFATAFAHLFWSAGYARILALGLGFGLAEWARSILLTGFPWNMIGYAAMPVPILMQSVNLVGMIGMSALAVVVFASPALLSGGRFARTGILVAILLVLFQVSFGWWQISSQTAALDEGQHSLTVRIIQPSIRQDLKWDQFERRHIFDTYIKMTEAAPKNGAGLADLVIWPETSVPYLLNKNPEVLERIGQALRPGQTLFAGAVREESAVREGRNGNSGEVQYFNSITVINDKGQITDSYDKVHLVPFGEYLPFADLLRSWGLQEIVEMPGGFTAGEYRHSLPVTPISGGKNISVLPLICYEAIFPDELSYSGEQASLMVNVTNDAWYGNTPGPYQHLRQAQLRAVEQGLPMIRGANNGISAVIDSYGRIDSELKLDEIGILDAVVPPKRSLLLGRAASYVETSLILILLLTGTVLFRNNAGNI